MANFTGGPEPNNYAGTNDDDSIDGGGGDDTLHDGGGGHDTILGGFGGDDLTGTNGNDLLEGNDGNDRILSGEDADTLLGGIGHDVLTDNGGGNDTLEGGEGNDTLIDLFGTLLVSSGDDFLSGGNGNDIIHAGTGNDTMTGGAGIDTFDGGPHRNAIVQTDIVTDFELGIDKIDLTSIGISEFDTVFHLITDVGGDLAIRYRTSGAFQTLILDGVAPGTVLTAADFVFSTDSTATAASGSSQPDDMFGARGNDTLTGLESPDRLFGEHGDDTLNGHADDDQLYGGLGNDSLNGGSDGNDTLDGGAGNDALTDGGIFSGNDVLRGGAGNDTLSSGRGDDVLTGGVGRDRFDGGGRVNFTVQVDTITDFVQGQDKLDIRAIGITDFAVLRNYLTDVSGNAALRYLAGGALQTLLLEGIAPGSLSASDFFFSTDNAPRSIIGTTGRDDLFGGGGNDTIFATESNDVLWGAGGADSLNGGSESDTISGGAGADTLVGGNDSDTYLDVDPTDTIMEGNGPGTGLADIIFTRQNFSLAALPGIEHVTLTGSAHVNATGNAKDNMLTGNVGNNVLEGGDGFDTLTGGSGHDTYRNPGADLIVEFVGGGSDIVVSDQSFSLAAIANVERIVLIGAGDNTATGNTLSNLLTGNSGDNTLLGGEGNDTLIGGSGIDELDGGTGADSMEGGSGHDVYRVDNTSDKTIEAANSGVDTVHSTVNRTLGDNIEHLRLEGALGITGNGNALNNQIFGNSGANFLQGFAGKDTLVGGAGNDTLSGGTEADTFGFAASGTGTDTIVGFEVSLDRFDLSGGFFTARSHSNGTTILTHAGGTIRVNGITGLTLANWNALVDDSGAPFGSASYAAASAWPWPDHDLAAAFREQLTTRLQSDISRLVHGDFIFA